MIFDSWTKALIYFGVINVLGLIVMGADKWKAKHNAWRIPEKTLFLVSLLGGSIGTWAGMYLFRHKTKALVFRCRHAGNPCCAGAHIGMDDM